ncbi:MAG: hypothetical protein ABIF17_05335, partial [Patescibacteria group bacterium]
MQKYRPVILTSIISSVLLSLVSFFVPHMDGVFIPYLILVGCFMVWVQKENKSYKFLVKLLVGSLVFGFLVMFLIFLKMYIFSHIYHAPLPFKELWDKDTLVLSLVYVFLSFFGGLLGIFLKGIYSIYKQKLNWWIVFVGSLLTTIASLAVFKVKIGGTIMSGYFGLPYSYFTYQIKDVVDGFKINKWFFSPGTLYHYLILNYLIYLVIFVAVYYIIKFINKRFNKKINSTLILFGLLIVMIVSFVSYLPARKSYIDYQIAGANYCEQDKDCVFAGTKCPFGCGITVNSSEAERITNLVYSFPSTCEYDCSQTIKTACLQGRCEVVIDHTTKPLTNNLTTNNFGNDQIEKAISNYLLTEKRFSWKNRQDSHNFCAIENLKPDQELFPLYIWAYCGEYIIEDGKLKTVSGSSGPVKIDYPNELSYYALNKFSYEVPGDGSNYAKDIKRIFPEDVQQKILNHNVKDLIAKAKEYAFTNISNWNLIKQAVANCEIESIMQTHALEITAIFKDSRELMAQ